MIDLVKYPVITEKTVRLIENDQYTFDLDLRLSKPQIKKLIEELLGVVVIAVNTHRPPRKKKRLGLSQGFKTSYKRVIVTIKRETESNSDTKSDSATKSEPKSEKSKELLVSLIKVLDRSFTNTNQGF